MSIVARATGDFAEWHIMNPRRAMSVAAYSILIVSRTDAKARVFS
jgi:hypothetical protein